MAITVGCFALVDPFTVLEHQLERIRDLGFRYADITDNRDGAQLGVEFGFAATSRSSGRQSRCVEIDGDEAVLKSYKYLKSLGAE